MIKNYIKIALRNIYKNKVFSLINIFGLSIGMASCILILLFVKNELSYDRFHKNTDEIFRVSVFENYSQDQQFFNSITPIPLGPTLKENFPEVKQFVRLTDRNVIVKTNNKSFPERLHLADPALFTMFDFPLLKGNTNTALKEPNSIVISRSAAEKYFGSENPVGKTLSIKLTEEYQDFVVTAVSENVHVNSSIQFGFVIPFEKSKEIFNPRAMTSWTNIFCETYILTSDGVKSSSLEDKVPALVKTLMGENYKPGEYNLRFQPLKDIHLNTDFPTGLEPVSNPVYSYILSIIAILILITASINFITLSIGRSASRAGEVCIRKVIGADRASLIRQFWGESVILVFIAAVAAVVLAETLLPAFNNLSGKTLSLEYDFFLLAGLAGIILFIGLIAGIYPALILSSFKPVDVMKGKIIIKSRSRLRQALVAGQFTVSIILIAGTLIISDQLQYIKNKNLGYNKDHIIVIPSGVSAMETFKLVEVFRHQLRNNAGVINVSASSNPMNENWNFVGFEAPGGTYEKFFVNFVDYDFVKTFGIQLIKGRDFSREYTNDITESVIVNEAFARLFKTDAISGRMPGNFNNNKIIGVVKNFHFESLHNEIKPAALVMDPTNLFRSANDVGTNISPKIFVRVNPADFFSVISVIQKNWEQVMPQVPFEFSFLDETINSKYQSESRLASIVTASSAFTIVITCMGLLGLTMLITVKRTKEIGIRKVLGASAGSIFKLLTKEFALIIFIANIAALPIAYYLMNTWLQDFSYRVPVNFWSLLSAGLIILVISMITIGTLVIRAAGQNPVKSLKYE